MINDSETEPNFFAPTADDDAFEDEPEALDYKSWLEENIGDVDPWKNVELESTFQYRMEDDEFSLDQINA